jgi:hypothetical protein
MSRDAASLIAPMSKRSEGQRFWLEATRPA